MVHRHIYVLASVPGVEKFKLFNLFGLMFDILGVGLLTELMAKSSQKYSAIAKYFYFMLWSFVISFPFGMTVGAALIVFVDLPSASVVSGFALSIFGLVAVPLFVLDYSGEIFKSPFYKTPTSRIVFLGSFLLVCGLAMQMFAAILDLMNAS